MDSPNIPPEAYADDQRTAVVGSVVFCVMFSATMVSLRLYTRTKVIVLYGIDDMLTVAALVSGAALDWRELPNKFGTDTRY